MKPPIEPIIWLVYHKATLSENSPLNMDGSEWMEGICVVPADNVEAALKGYRDLLKKDHMEEIEVYKVLRYREEDYANDEHAKHIAHGVRVATDQGETAYIGTLTSEGFADQEDEAGNE